MLNTKYDRIRKAIEILLEHIDKRFELTEIMIAAAILDPSVQHLNAMTGYRKRNRRRLRCSEISLQILALLSIVDRMSVIGHPMS